MKEYTRETRHSLFGTGGDELENKTVLLPDKIQ